MAKIAIITDTHIGARNDELNVYKNMKEFYHDTFFPELKKRKIKSIVHMGDVFDRRKLLNTQILQMSKVDIFSKYNEFDLHVIAGNHDCYYNSTNDWNSFSALNEFDNFKFYTDATTIEVEGFPMMFIPWINRENYDKTVAEMKKSKATVAFGHLEITGFEFHTGSICKHGLSASMFKKFKNVYSGHFHKKSSNGNITYLGSPYQTTWIEHTETKGFHIFDTKTLEMEFIENPNRLFIEINDDCDSDVKVEGKYVRIGVTEEKSKLPQYDILRSKLEEAGAIKVTPRITEKMELKSEVEISDESVDDMDIITISNEYIDKLEYSSKEPLKDLMATLYREVNNNV